MWLRGRADHAEPDRALARLLDLVHRLVGGGDGTLGRDRRIQEGHDADAAGDLQMTGREGLAKLLLELGNGLPGSVAVGVAGSAGVSSCASRNEGRNSSPLAPALG